MRILLIEPAKAPRTLGGEDVFIYEPLALEYLAAGVAADHDVQILDMRLEKDLERVLADFDPHLVGLTAYTVNVNTVRQLCERIKNLRPEVLTVVGGHHATIVPADFGSPHIDLIVVGEGVGPLREIAARHERKGDLYDTPGVAHVRDGKLLLNAPAPQRDLDALPFPDRTSTARYRHHYFSEYMRPLASLRTSKGCPFRCNFCALWKLTGGRYLGRAPEKVVEELAQIEEEFVFFADDESLVGARRMARLAELIRQANIRKRFFLYGRSDTICKHPELLAQWREIGLERVFVGLEFFRDRELAAIGKEATVRDNEEAVRILQGLDIDVYASFIIRPEYTRDDFDAFARYCRQLNLMHASFAVLTPLPGADLYEQVKDQLITDNYDFFDLLHTLLPTRLELEDFYRQYHRLLNRAITPAGRLKLIGRSRLRDWPDLMVRTNRFMRQLRNAYRDYEQ